MKYYLYIIECSNDTLYTGITTDLQRRFNEHKKGQGSRYTLFHPPTRILYTEPHRNRSEATKREHEIKSWTRDKKLQLIGSNCDRAGYDA